MIEKQPFYIIILMFILEGGVIIKRAKRLSIIALLVAISVLLGASTTLAQTYIVQKGDSLFFIGKSFGQLANEIKSANKLKSDTIYPGQKLHINTKSSNLPNKNNPSKSTSYVLGFYVDKEPYLTSSYNRVNTNGNQISAIAPFWYRLSPTNVNKIEEHRTGNDSESKSDVIHKAQQNDIEVLMLVHNLLYGKNVNGKELAAKMLATAETRKSFIDQLEYQIKENGYDGVNIDIENIYLSDRDKFSLLIKELFQRLAPQGYKVTVCVPAKTGDNRSNSWSGPFDYQVIGKYSHYVAVMTYDEHGYSTTPGPIASYGWARDVMEYSVSRIPPEKILLGIPGYGFDWKVGQKSPTYLSYSQAMEGAASRGLTIKWDNKSKVPYFKYWDNNGQEHQVWFENASSLTHKLNIVNEYNLGGIAIWRLGMEDPQMWKVIGEQVKAIK